MVTLEKMEIVRELLKGDLQRVVAEKFRVTKSTVGDIWNYRQKIEDYISRASRWCMQRNAASCVSQNLTLWIRLVGSGFVNSVAKGAPVSGVLLQEKARVFFAKLYPDTDPDSFKGSTGWLRKFNLHHGIKNTALQGEILSADLSAVDPFREELQKLIESEGLTRDQIYNAVETGLW